MRDRRGFSEDRVSRVITSRSQHSQDTRLKAETTATATATATATTTTAAATAAAAAKTHLTRQSAGLCDDDKDQPRLLDLPCHRVVPPLHLHIAFYNHQG
jgi:hypothetical protein